jgi:small redox-active disulfide protein 2
MKIEVLGTGCRKCLALEHNARAAVAELGITAEIEHVTDVGRIVDRGVFLTPALVVDGVVETTGSVPSTAEITALLAAKATP